MKLGYIEMFAYAEFDEDVLVFLKGGESILHIAKGLSVMSGVLGKVDEVEN